MNEKLEHGYIYVTKKDEVKKIKIPEYGSITIKSQNGEVVMIEELIQNKISS